MKKAIIALLLISGLAYGQRIGKIIDGVPLYRDSASMFAIAQELDSKFSSYHKFGEAPDFDSTDNEVDIWDGANDGGYNQMTYVFSSTNDIDSIISSATNDVTDVRVEGLDVNWNFLVQTNTLNGQTRVALGTPLRRVFRMSNIGSSNFVGDVVCYITNSSTTAGVVDNSADVRAIINNGNNQTLMSIYTVPNGKTGYITDFWAASAGASKTTDYKIRMYERQEGGVFRLIHSTALVESGVSHFQHVHIVPEKFEARTDIKMSVDILGAGISGADISSGFDVILVDN